MRRFRSWIAAALWLLPLTHADVRNCTCDVAVPATLELRECSLCKEVEKYPESQTFLFIRDANPNKPNRWLALPRFHGNRPEQLSDMSPELRTQYWNAAIGKARENWGDGWGIALNSTEKRTQCHLHFHIGRLLPDTDDDRFALVDRVEDIPVPKDGDGIWIHPVNGRLHVHTPENAGELKLAR